MKPPVIFIASKNQHKIAEIKAIFNNIGVGIAAIGNLGDIPEAIEDGKNFAENALKKAEHYYSYIKEPLIADDSGLVVPALNGLPGIYSARYAGEPGNYSANNRKLLEAMQKKRRDERFAYFVCHAVYKNHDKIISAEGRLEGRITLTARGKNGFGYDPLFELPDKGVTLAEISEDEKNRISHRYKALSELAKKIDEQLKNTS